MRARTDGDEGRDAPAEANTGSLTPTWRQLNSPPGLRRPLGTADRGSIALAKTARASARRLPHLFPPSTRVEISVRREIGSLEPFLWSAPERIRTSDLRFRRPRPWTPNLALASRISRPNSPRTCQKIGLASLQRAPDTFGKPHRVPTDPDWGGRRARSQIRDRQPVIVRASA